MRSSSLLYWAADCSFILSIMESMILKCPVIATPVGGIPDLIKDGQTGLLFPVEDEKALASNIEKLLEDRELYNTVADKAYEHIYENFNTEHHMKMVQEAFDIVIAGKHGREESQARSL